jgi:UPF0755 protein
MLKKIFYFFLILAIVGSIAAYWAYNTIYTPNTSFENDKVNIQIAKNSSYTNVLNLIKEKQLLNDYVSFDRVAGWMNYKRKVVPSGNFLLKKGWNNKELITKLRSGIQEPKTITFNNVRTIEEVMGPISVDISLDSTELVNYFTDAQTLSSLGYTKETILSLFIPNSYELYWDVSIDELTKKMVNAHNAFWNQKNRKEKCEALGMTAAEVYTLASIVEKESQYGPEKPIIAGLYLNRIKKGIHLQADPTVVFANGDFGLRRVLNKHLKFDSPYNTYKYPGLPPGPIFMPSIQSIDAVLSPEKHDYIFMCAKPGYGAQHAFAKTNRGHEKNANIYRTWLNQQGIK